MNDFTKKELELLREGLNYAIRNLYGLLPIKYIFSTYSVDIAMPLYNKITALIDNYKELAVKEE